MGFLTLLLPWWLGDWSLRALRSQDWVSIDLFRREHQFLKKCSIWCVVLSVAFSWKLTGSFRAGILFWVLCPLFYLFIVKSRFHQLKRQILRDFISSLYTLKGLLDVGTPFPHALFIISQESSNALALLFNRIIRRFQDGKSLEGNLKNLPWQSSEEWVLRSFKLLEQAYRKGLALNPLVESLIQVVELESQVKDRINRLQKTIGIQALFAAVIPWVLGGVCWFFQPEIMEEVFQTGIGKRLLAMSLLWEGLGIWLLRHAIRFY